MPQVRRGGRPSRAASEQLGERILDAATQMFLAQGFGATSIDALAQQLRMSKRTFYHRYPNKESLFAAVVHRIIQRLRPPPDIPLTEGADVQTVLERLASMILSAAVSPQAIA
jgi:TetR/AcrR family transcriptional repressor of mexJK operon